MRFHKDGVVLLGLVAIAIGLQVGGKMLGVTEPSDDIGLALACVVGWSISVLPFHHEVAHAAIARREGIDVVGGAYSAGRAFVRLEAPSTGVTPRAWTRTLAAGVVSNAVVALIAVACWLAIGPTFDPIRLFLLGVFAVELLSAIVNSLPVANTDGRLIRDVLRIARSPAPS